MGHTTAQPEEKSPDPTNVANYPLCLYSGTDQPVISLVTSLCMVPTLFFLQDKTVMSPFTLYADFSLLGFGIPTPFSPVLGTAFPRGLCSRSFLTIVLWMPPLWPTAPRLL